MHSAQQLYTSEIVGLDPSEQLRLATLILEGLSKSPSDSSDVSDCWSDKDIRDATIASLLNAAKSFGEN